MHPPSIYTFPLNEHCYSNDDRGIAPSPTESDDPAGLKKQPLVIGIDRGDTKLEGQLSDLCFANGMPRGYQRRKGTQLKHRIK